MNHSTYDDEVWLDDSKDKHVSGPPYPAAVVWRPLAHVHQMKRSDVRSDLRPHLDARAVRVDSNSVERGIQQRVVP